MENPLSNVIFCSLFTITAHRLILFMYLVTTPLVRGLSTRNAHMVHNVNSIRFKWVEVSFHISTTWWVSLLVDQWVPEGISNQVLRSTSVDFSVWEHQNFPCSKLIEIVILWVYYTIPFGFRLFRHFWDITFRLTVFGKGSLMRVQYPKCAYGPYC